MAALEWRLTILSLVVLPVFIVPAKRVGRRLQGIQRENMATNAEMNSQMAERFNVAGALLVKLFGRQNDEVAMFAGRAVKVRNTGIQAAMYGRVFFVALGLVGALGAAAIYGVGAHLVVDGNISSGTLVALATLVTRVYQPLTGLTNARVDLMTAREGQLQFEGERDRYMQLRQGQQSQGPIDGGLDFRMMRFATNEVALPERAQTRDRDDPALATTAALLADGRPMATAELHARLAPPLLALAFALMTLPLARSSPRQQRYGRLMLGFLAYLVCINLMFIGTRALADGRLPGLLGLWWLTLPLLALAVWMYQRDGRLAQPRRVAT